MTGIKPGLFVLASIDAEFLRNWELINLKSTWYNILSLLYKIYISSNYK